MNILVITKRLPYPLEDGANLRMYHLLKEISRRHSVFLVSIIRSPGEAANAAVLEGFCREVRVVELRSGILHKIRNLIRSFLLRKPYTVLANTDDGVRQVVEAVCRDNHIDVIQLEELYVADNLPAKQQRGHVVLDSFNIEFIVLERLAGLASHPIQRFYYRAQARFMEAYEKKIAESVQAIFCVSYKEAEHFRKLNAATYVVPNGVDSVRANERDDGATRENTILFTGSLNYPPNREALLYFFKEIWPRVQKRNDSVSVSVVGRRAPKTLLSFQSSRVRFFQDVDNIGPFFLNSKLMFVPLRSGGGTRLKILQAFSHMLPVVSTSIGAEGLEVEDNVHLLLADNPKRFAQAICALLEDEFGAQALATNACTFVQEKYLWSDIVKRALDCYERLQG